jgi:hypothetical protein
VNSGATPTDNGSVAVYPALAKLDSEPAYPYVKPLATIVGAKTNLAHPQALALDRRGRIYVLNANEWSGKPGDHGSVTVYPFLGDRTGILDETPIATIAGPDTKLDMGPMDIAVWDPGVN